MRFVPVGLLSIYFSIIHLLKQAKSGFAYEEDVKLIARQIRDRISQVKRDRERKHSAALSAIHTTADTSKQTQHATEPHAITAPHPAAVSQPVSGPPLPIVSQPTSAGARPALASHPAVGSQTSATAQPQAVSSPTVGAPQPIAGLSCVVGPQPPAKSPREAGPQPTGGRQPAGGLQPAAGPQPAGGPQVTGGLQPAGGPVSTLPGLDLPAIGAQDSPIGPANHAKLDVKVLPTSQGLTSVFNRLHCVSSLNCCFHFLIY